MTENTKIEFDRDTTYPKTNFSDTITNIQLKTQDFKTIELNELPKYKVNSKINPLDLKKKTEIRGWNEAKNDTIDRWRIELEYSHIVCYFFLNTLKSTEGLWAWIVIVISTLSSTLALIQLEGTKFENYQLPLKIVLSAAALCTTLIAAWMKKENYVERINNLDRYVQKVHRLIIQIENILSQHPNDRIEYDTYNKTYHVEILDLLSTSPPISPEEYKDSVYTLTRYYPELIENIYPWYVKIGSNKFKMTRFGSDILNTYWYVKYKSTSSRLCSFYYCKSSCCYPKIRESIFLKKKFERRPGEDSDDDDDAFQSIDNKFNNNKFSTKTDEKINDIEILV